MTISARLSPRRCPVPAASNRASSRRNSGLPLLARARRGAPRSSGARVPPRRAAGRRRPPRRARAGRRRSTSAPLSRSGPTCSHPTPASPVRRVAQQTRPRHPASRSSSRSASNDGSSAHWTSSTTSSPPRSATTTSRRAANSANRSSVRSALTSGTSWRHTQNGGAPSSAPCAQRTRVASSRRRTPAPGSTCRCPPRPR